MDNNLAITIETLARQRSALDAVIELLNGQRSYHAVEMNPPKAKRKRWKKKLKPSISIREMAEKILKGQKDGLETRELVSSMEKLGRKSSRSSITTVAQTLKRHPQVFVRKKGRWNLAKTQPKLKKAVSMNSNKVGSTI